MTKEQIKKLFNQFIANYDEPKHRAVWIEHEKTFRDFWKTKIMNESNKNVSEADYDPIIKLIDVKARGFRREKDEAVAKVGLYTGTWYRIFNDLKREKDIRDIMDKIFKSDEERVLIEMINRLEKANEKNKNGLTGKGANALNALLFLNNPFKFISIVSLTHRFQITDSFTLGNPTEYKTFGEKIVQSNRAVIDGFKNQYGIDMTWPRIFSIFLYLVPEIKGYWQKESPAVLQEERDVEEVEQEEIVEGSRFPLEKHLEDFLVGNWESTELGKKYDLVEEDGKMVSQQHPAGKGRIDLLVKDKKNGGYIVIELKRGQSSNDTVGQLTAYMGWVKNNLANGKNVSGIIIAYENDDKLKDALAVVPNTQFFVYRINFKLEEIN